MKGDFKPDESRKISFPDVALYSMIRKQGTGNQLGKRNRTPPCSSEELFFAERNGGNRQKISVADVVSLVFIGFLCRPPAWKICFEP